MKIKTNRMATLLVAVVAAVLCACTASEPAFHIGADMSYIPQNEARGMKYLNDEGREADILQVMADHHFDIIRLRIFVHPDAPKGYSPERGFCDLAHTLELAKRIKKAGMSFALDFHYSDTWADPDKQYKSGAWEGLSGQVLCDTLYAYTRRVLATLKEAGVAPKVVQVGNEINHGMVWPDGFINDTATAAQWTAMLNLYKAGQRAVREVLPKSKLMVHLALGGENTLCRQYLDKMNEAGAEFDIIGLSYYEAWHETYDDLKANLDDLAARYGKPVCVCEYSASLDNVKRLNDIVRSVPNGLGYGTMAWEPGGALFPVPDSLRRAMWRRNANAAPKPIEIAPNKALFAAYDAVYAEVNNPAYVPDVKAPFARKFRKPEQIIGADISWVPQQEAHGMKFSDKGVQKDVLQILKEHHFNWIRLRLFVDPTAEKGYSKDGFCGLEQTLAMAKRIKAAGMSFLLDFHYSDTWADPGKQFTPSAWSKMQHSALEGQLYRYTNETIKRFIAEGVRPDMVQVGNEIDHGMVWPQGKIERSYQSFGVLLRCGCAAVRAADPTIMIMVHIACGGQNEESVRFFDNIISRDVKFDIIGQSYYPKFHGTTDELRSNLTDLAGRYGKPIIVVEYNKERIAEVNNIVRNLPNGMGWGTFIWEATSQQWGGLFDNKGRTTPLMGLYDEM